MQFIVVERHDASVVRPTIKSLMVLLQRDNWRHAADLLVGAEAVHHILVDAIRHLGGGHLLHGDARHHITPHADVLLVGEDLAHQAGQLLVAVVAPTFPVPHAVVLCRVDGLYLAAASRYLHAGEFPHRLHHAAVPRSSAQHGAEEVHPHRHKLTRVTVAVALGILRQRIAGVPVMGTAADRK